MIEGATDYKRPSWDTYFLEIMDSIAKRGTCERGRSGCVIAKDKQIIAAGYVGSPIGEEHCDDIGHLFQKRYDASGNFSLHCVRTVHAEQNAICQAAQRGVSINGATLYCRMTPCPVCAKMIINCGIKRVVCEKRYHDGAEAERLFLRAGIALEHIDESEEQYGNKGNLKKTEDPSSQPAKLEDIVEQPTEELKLKIKKISFDAVVPNLAHESDAGLDLTAIESVQVPSGSRVKIQTGLIFEIPKGHAGLIWDRSGLSTKKGLKVLGGVIDSGYRGEVIVALANISKEPVEILKGDKIAQIIIQKIENPKIEIVEETSETERGDGGFGSTDIIKTDIADLSDGILEDDIIDENIFDEEEDGKSRW